MAAMRVDQEAVVQGIALADEVGIGASTLGGYMREIADRYGPLEAAVVRHGDAVERWSYNHLLDRSIDVARALVACGVGKGTRVGILLSNRLEFLSGMFGAALVGAVGTPISTFSTPTELESILAMACCRVLLTESSLLKKNFLVMLGEMMPGLNDARPGAIFEARFPFLRHIVAVDLAAEAAASAAIEGWDDFLRRGDTVSRDLVDAMVTAVQPSDPAVLFFSSGSTGKPKGVLSAHYGVCLQLWRWPMWYGITTPPRTWVANGFFWSGNFAMALGGTLSSGGTLILQRWFDAEEALRLIEAERASMLIAWPHQWAQLVAAPGYAEADLSSLRYVESSSPIADHPSARLDWREPSMSYGSTETFTLISAHAPGEKAAGDAPHYGRPTAGSTIRIVDPVAGRTLDRGEHGEIAVKGPTLMLGYLGVPLADTLDEEGYFRTGDGGSIDVDGRLFWTGRLNDIIKTGGANVSPIEVDEVIRLHPQVRMTQTLGVPDPLLGEIVVTCIVPHTPGTVTTEEIKAFARTKLASYKTPRRVLFFADEDIATTGSAKVKVDRLRELAHERLFPTCEVVE